MESIECVWGLTKMKRWTSTCVMKRQVFLVPSIISAYNLYMNGVDKFDQVRSTNSTQRKEQRVSMTIFTFLLDSAIQNAYSILPLIDKTIKKKVEFRHFKREIAKALVKPFMDLKNIPMTPVCYDKVRIIQKIDEAKDEKHYLVDVNHKGDKNVTRVACFLCRVMLSPNDNIRKTRTACIQCRKFFHVNCFYFFHNQNNLMVKYPYIIHLIKSGVKDYIDKLMNKETNRLCNIPRSIECPFYVEYGKCCGDKEKK